MKASHRMASPSLLRCVCRWWSLGGGGDDGGDGGGSMVDVGGGARDHVSAFLSVVRKTVSEEEGVVVEGSYFQ